MFKYIFFIFWLALSAKAEDLLIWSNEAPAENISDSDVVSREPFLIFRPGAVVNAERKTKSGIQIYRATYKFDSHSRRETTVNQNINYRNIVLLGCSYTLGTGLNNDETFSYFLSQLRKDNNVYNLGIYGAGANDVLDDLRSFARFKDISKAGGVVIYTGITDHFERTFCTLNCYRPTYRDWVKKKSNYEFDSRTEKLVNLGSFTNSRPLKGLIYNLMAAIPLFDKVNIPPEMTGSQLELFVRMLAEMKSISKEKLNSEFYFTFYPQQYEYWPRVQAELEKQQIKYLDLSKVDFAKTTGNRHVIMRDGHPSKLASRLYADVLNQKLPK